MNTFLRFSHTVEGEFITQKGLLAPIAGNFLSREISKENHEEGTEFHINVRQAHW